MEIHGIIINHSIITTMSKSAISITGDGPIVTFMLACKSLADSFYCKSL